MKLKNKIIIVTGAGTGLGREVSIKAAEEGATLVLIGRNEKNLREVEKQIKGSNRKSRYFICDIKNETQIKETVKKIFDEFKQVDILINNAGVWTDEEIEKDNPKRRKEAFETNALGNINFTNEVLPHFKKTNKGYIFTVISSAGITDIEAGFNTRWKTYYASKWALSGYTKALREELSGTKIKLTAFFPGGFESMLYEKAGRPDAHAQPWMMKATDVADIVIFALTRPDDVSMDRIMVSKAA